MRRRLCSHLRIMAIVLFLFAIFAVVSYAQNTKRYVVFPVNAGKGESLEYHKNMDSRALNIPISFEIYGKKAFERKATRVYSKKIIEEVLATPTFSIVDVWERNISVLKDLDLEAELAMASESLDLGK